MPRCAITDCKNSTDVNNQVNRDISFHRFPQDPNLKEKWIEATGKKDWFPTKFNTICSKHFTEACFVEGKKYRILTTTACPTIDVMEITTNKELHSNVAGSLVEACIICLATDDDVTLYSLQYGQLKLYMDTILAINNDSHRGLPQFVCYECAVHLKKCYKLIKKCETSQAILVNILAQYGEITKTLVRNLNKENLVLKSPLESHNTTPMYVYDYKYNYEQNISCLDKIEYIYDSTDNKIELDSKSDNICIQRDHIDDNDVNKSMGLENEVEIDDTNDIIISIETCNNDANEVTENSERDRSIQNKRELDTNSDVIPIQTDHIYLKHNTENLKRDHSIVKEIELNTNCDKMPKQTDDNDVIENLKLEHDVSNKRDANYTKSVIVYVLCDKEETNVDTNEECSILNHDDGESTGLSEDSSDENTVHVLASRETIAQNNNVKNKFTITKSVEQLDKNNVKNIFTITKSGEQSDKKEDKRSPLSKYFKIVKFTTLQEKIDEWRKSTENPSWAKRNPNNLHKCEVCWKLFSHPSTLQQHSISHSSVFGDAECPVCKIRHKDEKTVRKHMTYLHCKKYYCKACPKSFTTRSAATRHHLSHSGDVFKCERCSYTSVLLSALNNHMAFVHSEGFPCDLCGRAFLNDNGLQQHLRRAHPADTVPYNESNSNVFSCEKCKLSFTTEEALRMHLLNSTRHKELKKSEAMKNTCRLCGRKLPSYSDFKEHLWTAHTKYGAVLIEYPTVCKYCDEELQTRKDHYWHMRRQHPDERYHHIISAVCEVCGKGFRSTKLLKRHRLRHSSPKIPCPICDKKFHDKSLLEQHLETHRTERPHVCPTCGHSFKNKPNLYRHMKIHTDVTPYECSICGKQLKHKTNLKVHIRTIHHKILCPSMINKKYRRRERRRQKNKNKVDTK